MRNRGNRKHGLSARNQHEIHENDYVLRKMCTLGDFFYIIRQKLLHYQVVSLLHYRVMLLHYQAVITLSADFITLSGSYYINRRLLHYRL